MLVQTEVDSLEVIRQVLLMKQKMVEDQEIHQYRLQINLHPNRSLEHQGLLMRHLC